MRWLWLSCAIFLFACNEGAPADAAETSKPPQVSASAEPAPVPVPAPASAPDPDYTTRFDAQKAWQHLLKQVDLGFRVPGTPGHKACRAYLQQELLKHCDVVEEQEFTANLPAGPTKMYNIVGRFNLQSPRRILLCAHWDTRPTADFNPAGQRDKPIPGANDGASGVAVLLELARVLGESPPPLGVDIVLFDGEDYGPSLDHMFYGSKHFARQLSREQAKGYNYGILLDMVGDKHLNIHPEHNSEAIASEVFAVAYTVSRELGYRCFQSGDGLAIEDDHLPLIARGIPVYDFIDFAYPDLPGEGTSYWHTTEDTPDKCSADSLEAVGRTVEVMVYEYPRIYAPAR